MFRNFVASKFIGGIKRIICVFQSKILFVAPEELIEKESVTFIGCDPAKSVQHSTNFKPRSLPDAFSTYLDPFHLRESGFFLVKNGMVVGKSGIESPERGIAVCDPNFNSVLGGTELEDVAASFLLRGENVPLLINLTRPHPSNYFHWFLDILPKLRHLEMIEKITERQASLLVPAWLAPWQRRSLEILAPGRTLIIHRTWHGLFRLNAEILVVPTMARFHGSGRSPDFPIDPEVPHWLRRRFVTGVGGRPSGSRFSRRVLISRSRVDSRSITNLESLRTELKDRGFGIYQCEDLSLDDQVLLFSNAELIVALHGSGLTNLVFARDCKVIEIIPRGHGIRSEYFQISLCLWLKYKCMIVDSSDSKNDVVLDTKALVSKIDSMLGLAS